MPGKPIQVLVIPFRIGSEPEFAVFHRSDEEMWQFIAGGVEDQEDAMEAARREAEEEASIPSNLSFVSLDSVASIPGTSFEETEHWPEDLLVVPEYSFAVDVGDRELVLSFEHDEVRWVPYDKARCLLTWDSNRVALWELNERLANHTTVRPQELSVVFRVCNSTIRKYIGIRLDADQEVRGQLIVWG